MIRVILLLALSLVFALDVSAYERSSWATSGNNALDNTSTTTISKNAAWYLMQGIGCASAAWGGSPPAAGCWTYYCGSDSVTADPCDGTPGTDPWGSTYDGTKLVAAAANTAHSWITFKAPASAPTTAFVTFDYLAANSVTVAVSKTAPAAIVRSLTTTNGSGTITTANTTGILVGMAISGTGIQANTFVTSVSAGVNFTISPVANASGTNNLTIEGGIKSRYSATDEWTHPTWAFNTASIVTQNRAHLSLSSSGDFWFCSTRDSTNIMCEGSTATPFVFNWLSDTKSGDAFTAVAVSQKPSTAGAGTSSWTDTQNASFRGRDSTNATSYTFAALVPAFYAPAGALAYPFGTGNTYNLQGTGDTADSKQDDFPIYLFSGTTSQTTLKGRMVDFRLAPTVNAQGSCAPSVAPYESTILGAAVWAPWNLSSLPQL